ncbi:MAG: hypothetical protein E6G00_09145 [Actinobacteria bacterium]|nr:MAG: hypothetical protein E6G00_09145 [Actinomycetota bacterium]
MSTVAIVVIVIAAVLLLFFIGGYVVSRRRTESPELDERIAAADRALEHARASDRGWDRSILERTARDALTAERPGGSWERVALVLVDDRPGVEHDRCHVVASGAQGEVRVVLARRAGGEWFAEEIG